MAKRFRIHHGPTWREGYVGADGADGAGGATSLAVSVRKYRLLCACPQSTGCCVWVFKTVAGEDLSRLRPKHSSCSISLIVTMIRLHCLSEVLLEQIYTVSHATHHGPAPLRRLELDFRFANYGLDTDLSREQLTAPSDTDELPGIRTTVAQYANSLGASHAERLQAVRKQLETVDSAHVSHRSAREKPL